MNIKNAVDKAYEDKSLSEIVESPIAALQGVSERQGALLKEAFRISTIKQLANLRFAKWAEAIQTFTGFENGDEGEGKLNIANAVDKAWEDKTPGEILDAPMSALEGVSPRQEELVYEAFKIKTVKQLANLKFYKISRAIVDMADREK